MVWHGRKIFDFGWQQKLSQNKSLRDSAATIALHPFHPADGLMLTTAQAFIILLVTFA